MLFRASLELRYGVAGIGMDHNILAIEIPERATWNNQLAAAVDGARELIEMRVGFDLELASLEPIDRDGHSNIRISWRRKAVEL
jgi:hypothetical protein